MTGHQINSLVGDLVAMAQAMERLPQVEADAAAKGHMIDNLANEVISLRADVQQAKDYAASLEAKVHAAEASRDDAELRFLEAEDKASRATNLVRIIKSDLENIIENEVNQTINLLNPPQPEPIISEVKPIAADPTLVHFDQSMADANAGSASSCESVQGQSEADPIPVSDMNERAIVGSSDIPEVGSANQSSSSWAIPTPPKPQPYAGHSYFDWPTYIPYDKWIEGGGTHNDYYEPRH